jgi:hypothetical protein
MEANVLTSKIWSDPACRTLYLNALLDLADLTDGGWLEQEAVREYEQIRDAARADPRTPYSPETFEEDSALVRQFARDRAGIVREYVRSLDPGLEHRRAAARRSARQ